MKLAVEWEAGDKVWIPATVLGIAEADKYELELPRLDSSAATIKIRKISSGLWVPRDSLMEREHALTMIEEMRAEYETYIRAMSP